MNRKPLLLVALVAMLALTLAAVALGSPNRKVWCAGNICIADDGGISPEALPKHGKAPVTARLNGEVSTRDGSHPTPFKSMDLKIDKTISLDAEGLPVCHKGQIAASTTATVKQVCGDAIVGSGEAEVEVAFPEQTPFRATGPLVLFNGGVKGAVTTLLLHAYVNVPAPTAIVVKAKITKIHEGQFGMRIQAEIPKIAGGAGSVTSFNLKINKGIKSGGKTYNPLTAKCTDGKLQVHVLAKFADGTQAKTEIIRACTPEG